MPKSTLIAPGYVEGQGSGVDRRQLLKAGAWATPVLVMAAAAPMAVASDRPKFDQAKITVSAECAYRSRSFTVKNTATIGVASVTLSLHAEAWGINAAEAKSHVAHATTGSTENVSGTGTVSGSGVWSSPTFTRTGTVLASGNAATDRTVTVILQPGQSVTFTLSGTALWGLGNGEPWLRATVGGVTVPGHTVSGTAASKKISYHNVEACTVA